MVEKEKLPRMCTDLTQQAGRKNQKRRTSKFFNHPQWSTTRTFQADALIWPSKQADRIKAEDWFDPASRQKESKEKNKQVIQSVDREKLLSRCTDLTQQAGRKNQSKRLIWPSKQAERIKGEEHASYSTIHNGRQRKASKKVHWFDPASRQKESKEKNKQVIQPYTTVEYEKLPSRYTDLTQQAGRKNQSRRLIWPSKQAERIKAEEHASYSSIHNGRLRKASKQVHWFDPASRQKESKQKTVFTQQAGRKNQSKRTSKLFNHPQRSTTKSFQAGSLIWPSRQTERIKAKEQASYSTIHNSRPRKASKQVHWFDPASRQKESKQKTDLTQQAGRKNQRRRTSKLLNQSTAISF